MKSTAFSARYPRPTGRLRPLRRRWPSSSSPRASQHTAAETAKVTRHKRSYMSWGCHRQRVDDRPAGRHTRQGRACSQCSTPPSPGLTSGRTRQLCSLLRLQARRRIRMLYRTARPARGPERRHSRRRRRRTPRSTSGTFYCESVILLTDILMHQPPVSMKASVSVSNSKRTAVHLQRGCRCSTLPVRPKTIKISPKQSKINRKSYLCAVEIPRC